MSSEAREHCVPPAPPAAQIVVQFEHNQGRLLGPFQLGAEKFCLAAFDIDLDYEGDTVGLAIQQIGDGDSLHLARIRFRRLPCPRLVVGVDQMDTRLSIPYGGINRRDVRIRGSISSEDLEVLGSGLYGKEVGTRELRREP